MKTKETISTIYSVAIEVPISPGEVFNRLIDLTKWWPEEFKGKNMQLNSEFLLTTGEGHFSRNKVIEFVPGKKFVWLVMESRREADSFDWTGTKMIFELTPNGGGTDIKFTYNGLVLENEVGRLTEICDFVIKERLFDYIINGSTI